MVQPHETDVKLLLDFFENPNTQSEAVHYIGCIRQYDKTKKQELLVTANKIANEMVPKMPYNEVNLDNKPTKSPNDIMLVTCLYLSELGLIPSYES